MLPEETAQAGADINTKLMMPIHWGKFSLAFHSWYEPPQRMLEKAKQLNVDYFLPEIGKTYTIAENLKNNSPWWNKFVN